MPSQHLFMPCEDTKLAARRTKRWLGMLCLMTQILESKPEEKMQS